MKYTVILERPRAWDEDKEVGVVQTWHRQLGDAVRDGDLLVTVALADGTGAAQVVSPVFGILTKKVILPGEAVEVGEPVALLSGVPAPLVTGAERLPSPPFITPAWIPSGPETLRPVSARDAALARAFAASQAVAQTTIAHADATEVARLGAKLNLPPLPFVLHTVAETLARHPDLNADWVETADGAVVRQKRYVHLGLVRHGADGLRVAVVRDAHHKSLRALAEEVTHLQTSRDDGTLPPDGRRGATFLVSEVPPGIAQQTALLHSPLAAHLTVGTVEPAAERPRVTLCLTHDARVATPEQAAAFLTDVCAGLRDGRFLFAG